MRVEVVVHGIIAISCPQEYESEEETGEDTYVTKRGEKHSDE